MKLKSDVRIQGIRPEMMIALMAAQDRFGNHGVIITSVCEGQHSHGSLHYSGCAVDLRINHLPVGTDKRIVRELSEDLGEQFDVVLEKTHIHIEYQPKTA